MVQFYTIYSHHIWFNYILYSHHIWINYILYSHHIWINSRKFFGCIPEMLVLLEINVLKKGEIFCVDVNCIQTYKQRNKRIYTNYKLLVV